MSLGIGVIYICRTLIQGHGNVDQSVERWSRDPVARVQFPAGGLGVIFLTVGWETGTKNSNITNLF